MLPLCFLEGILGMGNWDVRMNTTQTVNQRRHVCVTFLCDERKRRSVGHKR